MSRILKWLVGAVVFAGIAALLVWAFIEGRKELAMERDREKPVARPQRVTRGPGGEPIVTLDRETQARVALKVESLVAATLQLEAVAYGALQEDPSRSFTLRAAVSGVLRASGTRAWPELGETLADGAVVGSLEPRFAPVERVDLTSRLAAERADVTAATASLAAAKAALERAKSLNAEGKILSDRTLQEAEAKVKAEEARLKAATETVQLITASLDASRGPTGPMPLTVPRGGEVVEVLAQPGETVESGQPILRAARFDRLVAKVELPAGERVDERVATARLVVLGQEERPLRGTRIALGAAVDPKTRGQVFLFRVSGNGLALRPGAAVTAYLALPGEARKGVVVPRPALVRTSGAAWAYVEVAEAQFARRRVRLDDPTERGWFSPAGFGVGDRVVVDGAQTLLSEEMKSQITIGEEPGK